MTEIMDKNDKELNALIRLLDEPNNLMFSKIEEKILSYGLEAIPFLEESWDKSYDDLVQDRIETMIHRIQFYHTYNEFTKWANTKNPKLFDGYFYITKYMYPEVERDELLDKINEIKKDIWLELNDNLTDLQKVRIINHIIFEIHKFKSDRRSLKSIQSHFLNNLLESRKGSNLALGILYLIITESIDLPIFGIDLPRHFILACSSAKIEKIEKNELCSSDKVLFYINPFTKGSVLSKKEIDLFMRQINIPSEPAYTWPCHEIEIIRRLLREMLTHYKRHGYKKRVAEIKMFMKNLPKD